MKRTRKDRKTGLPQGKAPQALLSISGISASNSLAGAEQAMQSFFSFLDPFSLVVAASEAVWIVIGLKDWRKIEELRSSGRTRKAAFPSKPGRDMQNPKK